MKSSIVHLNLKTPFTMAAVFLMFYAVGQYFIAYNDISAPAYHLFTEENSFRVLLVSISLSLVLLFSKSKNKIVIISLDQNSLVCIYSIVLLITLVLCYLFPWGVFGQELGVGHSFKALMRHIYTVLSVLVLISYRKTFFFLIFIDVVLLFLDPSRVFFVETAFPKIFLLYQMASKIDKIKYIVVSAVAALLLMYIQSYRLESVGGNFIWFALYSDIMHATYPALQISQYYLDNPWDLIGLDDSFTPLYGETLAPLGGYFLPGSFIYSNLIYVDVFIGFMVFYLFIFMLKRINKLSINSVLFSGVLFLLQKFPLMNSIRLCVALLCSWFLVSFLCSVRTKSYVVNKGS